MHTERSPDLTGHEGKLSVYVNFPFCERPCRFCHYIPNLSFRHDAISDQYLDVVLAQATSSLRQRARDRGLVSLYLGGGTPSLLTAAQVDRLRNVLLDLACPIDERCIEIHPATWTPDYLELDFFDRYSIGVQSFVPAQLAAWSRVPYSIRDVARIIEGIRARDNATRINVDLLFDLRLEPSDLDAILALLPDSVTLYPRTRRRTPAELRAVYDELARAADVLTGYQPIHPRGFLFVRKLTDISQHAQHEYEVLGDILGLGHQAVSSVGEDTWLSTIASGVWSFQVRSSGDRSLLALLRGLRVGVPASLVERVDSRVHQFLVAHPTLPHLRFLPPEAYRAFHWHLAETGYSAEVQRHLRRSLFIGDDAVEHLDAA
jgi:coproporphyrinogen III oxidase-like Fe-S oxidoreductase